MKKRLQNIPKRKDENDQVWVVRSESKQPKHSFFKILFTFVPFVAFPNLFEMYSLQ